jgi:hypothetical protein
MKSSIEETRTSHLAEFVEKMLITTYLTNNGVWQDEPAKENGAHLQKLIFQMNDKYQTSPFLT